MYKINLNPSSRDKAQHVYFIGIGGVSMSSLAQILIERGFVVSGSDRNPSGFTRELEALGVTVYYGQEVSHITPDTDVVVYTAAVHPDNPEFQAAVAANLPMLTRADLLGQIMDAYASSYAIAGTHGKTTTTSMIAEILLEAQTDPTICNGGILPSIGSTTRIGHSASFVAEACEYTNSFFSFYPKYSIILNIEEDHLDFFKDLEDIRCSFKRFIHNTQKEGVCIINGTIPDWQELTADMEAKVVSFGLSPKDSYYAQNISYDASGFGVFDVYYEGQRLSSIQLSVPGEFNIYNALAAIATCHQAGLPMERIAQGLKNYRGAVRRFEYKGEINGVTIYDDYAHHPTEIQATLTAAKQMDFDRTVCVFQPHTYSRTKALLSDFAVALSHADLVILADIFPARETDTLGISSLDLKAEIEKYNIPCHYFDSFEKIQKFILKNSMHHDLLITMGAGDVVNIGNNLLK